MTVLNATFIISFDLISRWLRKTLFLKATIFDLLPQIA